MTTMNEKFDIEMEQREGLEHLRLRTAVEAVDARDRELERRRELDSEVAR